MVSLRHCRILLAAVIAAGLGSLPFLYAAEPAPATATAPAVPGTVTFTLTGDMVIGGLQFKVADAAPANALKLSTERVVIYKDGYALIIKSATCTTDAEGRATTTQVPDSAVLGTFWALSDQKTVGLRAEWDESKSIRETTVNCLTVKDLLRANVGKKVTLTLDGTAEKRSITGNLSQILTESGPAKEPTVTTGRGRQFSIEATDETSPFDEIRAAGYAAATPGAAAKEFNLVHDLTPAGGDYIVLDGPDAGGKTVLQAARVLSVTGDNLNTTITRTEEVYSHTKRLTVDFGKENANKQMTVKLMYFSPGMQWIPTYRISGELKDKADIALQGEVINDLEDINDAAVDLVVGVPNFRFKDSPSPLSLERTMFSTLANVRDNNAFTQSQYVSNGSFSNAANHIVEARPVAEVAPNLATGEQDLFVYPLEKASFKKGGRATLPLWQTTTDLKHVYTYDLKNRRSRSTGGVLAEQPIERGSDRRSPAQLTLNSIWHQLELMNNSKAPWTTGAALIMKNNLPLGQDLLTYTPPGSDACVPVTIAVDLRATTDEEETKRQNAALHVDGNDYALVTKKGTITLTSFRKEPSTMRITMSTGGKVESVSDDGKTKINDFRADDWDDQSYMRPNNHSDVTWEFTLEAGKSKTLTYTLSSYVR